MTDDSWREVEVDTGSDARRSWRAGVPKEEERDEYLDRKIPGPDVEVVKLETLVMPLDARVMPLDSRVIPLDVRDIPCDDEELA